VKTFQFEIITPERTIFSGPVASVVVPATGGKMGILANHAPLVASLDAGPMKVTLPDGAVMVFALGGGFVEVGGNEARVVADVGEKAEDIDEERARRAEERARKRIREAAPDMDLVRAEAALARALARIQALGALKGLPMARGRERFQAGGGAPH
jgi:F-type H+-transporting ATPase subunit epsilon